MRRLAVMVAAVTAFAVPVSIAAVTLTASPASASGTLTCSKLSGSGIGAIIIKKCNDLAPKPPKNTLKPDKQNKEMTGNGLDLVPGMSGTLTWSPSGETTTVESISATDIGQGTCKNSKFFEETATGEVTGGNSPYTSPGQMYSVDVCVASSNDKVSLAPGTSWTL
jgi:hypothetical protein